MSRRFQQIDPIFKSHFLQVDSKHAMFPANRQQSYVTFSVNRQQRQIVSYNVI